MSELRVYNTLTRTVEKFVPRVPGRAQVYVCGPTVYDIAHAGNARPPIVFDVLTRHLRASGYEVTYVRNITDVDDKIVERARANGEAPLALSARMTPIYQADMRALGCTDPTFEPKVSETIPEIVALVERLIGNGLAYEVTMPSGARDVYFAVRSFPDYGKLSRRNVDELEVGARVDKDDTKRDPLDFALWKGCVDADAFGWDSPWGKGRPGWHIECSAMAAKFLGHGFDIHGGGMDLIFPHHENEIAQSEGAYPDQGTFAHVWMHNGFLNVDKEKMSKSLGNFVRPCDVYRANDPEALRLVFLSVHYRGPVGFDIETKEDGRVTYPNVDEGERRVDYFYATWERLLRFAQDSVDDSRPSELSAFRAVIEQARKKVAEALDDDLNTSVAISVLGELAKAANELCDLLQRKVKDARLLSAGATLCALALAVLRDCTNVLGLLQAEPAQYRDRTKARRLCFRGRTVGQVDELIQRRAEARTRKDFKESDALRKELDDWGIEVADSPTGSVWHVRI